MTKLTFLALLALLSVASPARAQQAVADTGQVHIVRTGDTLWDLAGRYLNNPFLWPEIYSINRSTVLDPHRIYPEGRLLIPGRLGIGAAGAGQSAPPMQAVSRTVFFTEEQTAVSSVASFAETPTDELPLIPAGLFLAAAVLLPDAEIAPVGRLMEMIDPTIVARQTQPQIQPYDRVNMVVITSVAVGDRLHLVRPGALVEPFGRIFLPTGSARVVSLDLGVATIEVDQFYDQVAVGDLALAMPEFGAEAGVALVPVSELEGTLLAFERAQPIAATEDRAFVNLGAASGVVEGDELVAYLAASEAEWGRRPEVLVARLQVIRVERLTSTVRVVSLEYPALEQGMPVRLVARMP